MTSRPRTFLSVSARRRAGSRPAFDRQHHHERTVATSAPDMPSVNKWMPPERTPVPTSDRMVQPGVRQREQRQDQPEKRAGDQRQMKPRDRQDDDPERRRASRMDVLGRCPRWAPMRSAAAMDRSAAMPPRSARRSRSRKCAQRSPHADRQGEHTERRPALRRRNANPWRRHPDSTVRTRNRRRRA